MAMKPLENKPGMGVLFWRKADGNRPTLSGGVNIDGQEYEIAGWNRTSKAGKEYISLTIKPAGAGWQQDRDDDRGNRGRWEP